MGLLFEKIFEDIFSRINLYIISDEIQTERLTDI